MENIDIKLLNVINEKIKELTTNFDTILTDEKISSIINNIIKGQIDRHIANKTHEFFNKNYAAIIDNLINNIFDEEESRNKFKEIIKDSFLKESY